MSDSSISTSTNSASISFFITAIVVPIVVVLVVAAVVAKKLYWKAAQSLSQVFPRLMVQAPPDSQRGPVIAEFFANNQAGAVALDEATRIIPATVSSSAPISAQGSSRAMDEPSQVTQSNSLPAVHENDRRSRRSLDAGVDEASRTVNIHQDGGHVLDVDEAELEGSPPPYLYANVVQVDEPPRTVTHQDHGPIDLPPPYASIPRLA